jgi:hypothetical protein
MTRYPIVTGDDIGIITQLKVKQSARKVNASFAGATSVKLALISGSTIVLSKTCADGATFTDMAGTTFTADWAKGYVVATFTSAETRALNVGAILKMEIQVDLAGKTTWHKDVFADDFMVIADHVDTA